MNITQMIQTNPAKANELFGKLADTGDGAVKTREKLFAELKEELEQHARLEEQHLFPVLRKHKETKDLVADAVNDNKQTRALLAELERLPKDSEEFPRKLGELRKVFQQHVRDERKELLPVVRKALSDEEAQAITEKIEEAKRDEAGQRRTESRRERETTEEEEPRPRQAAAALTRPVATLAEGGRRTADVLDRTARPALDRLENLGALPGVATRAMNEAGEAWIEWANRTTRTTTDAAMEFTRLNSPLHLAQVQSRVVGETMKAWFDVSTRLAQISLRMSDAMMKECRR